MPAGAGGEKEKWNEELASKHAGAGGEVKPDGEHVGPRGERRGERWGCGVKRKRGQVAPRNVAAEEFRGADRSIRGKKSQTSRRQARPVVQSERALRADGPAPINQQSERRCACAESFPSGRFGVSAGRRQKKRAYGLHGRGEVERVVGRRRAG